MSNMYGVSAYQQAGQIWSQTTKKNEDVSKKTEDISKKTGSNNDKTNSLKTDGNVKTSAWKPIDTNSSLVPTNTDGIGMTIGSVQLSDKAKEYYNKLKAKFGNMEFIAVSQDMKSQVHANAAAYGNANKQVVLIDDAKLEMMANDESYRKKYEGIIAMSQSQLSNMKNSLASSGANVKNFGMSVNSDGTTSMFATLEKSSADQAKRLEKKQAEKKAAKAKAKKQAEKKEKEEKLEKAKEDKKVKDKNLQGREKSKETDENTENESTEKEYIKLESDSMEDLVNRVFKYAYGKSSSSVMTEDEKMVGGNFDLKS